ncbi:MAG TPA: hypothetical protein VNK73_10210 [Actinomycetota bacterium]|jgi:hypothetical protein|nr:hypothetical protein [Actinomycetota bacterium]
MSRPRWAWMWVQTSAGLVLFPLEIVGVASGAIPITEASLLLLGPFITLAPWTSVLATRAHTGELPEEVTSQATRALTVLAACWLAESVGAAALSGVAAGRAATARAIVFGLIAAIACWSTYSTWTSAVQLRQRQPGQPH